MTKRKNNINPENVGRWFEKEGESLPYKLVACGDAVFQRADTSQPGTPERITDIQDKYFLLARTKKRVEAVKKPRADKGGIHASRKKRETGGVRMCPTHKVALKEYPGGLWQCPKTLCEYEEKAE